MVTDAYFRGHGINVSKTAALPMTADARHAYVEPDNLYSLSAYAKPESADFIYADQLIAQTKFWRLMIKEWFVYCRVGGYIIIRFQPNRRMGLDFMVQECRCLLGSKGDIVEQTWDRLNNTAWIVIRKTHPALIPGDRIDRWTFGIISDGRREEWIERSIDTINELGISEYEIIICGLFHEKGRQHVRVIPYDSSVPWISRKKNMICRAAKYNNLVIVHDKFLFDKHWYEGMQKYGNYFEVLSCVIHDESGRRSGDWCVYGKPFNAKDWKEWGRDGSTYGRPIYRLGLHGLLDYRDWDRFGYIDGGFYILKKSVWNQCPWNDALHWGQEEDVDVSMAYYREGIVARFNPYSKCQTLAWNHKWLDPDATDSGGKRGELYSALFRKCKRFGLIMGIRILLIPLMQLIRLIRW